VPFCQGVELALVVENIRQDAVYAETAR
jgi:hypothetical protein